MSKRESKLVGRSGPVVAGDSIKPRNLVLQPGWERGLRLKREMCLKSNREEYRCQSEFELLTPADAEKLGLPKGTKAALHKCVKPKSMEGKFVPVSTPEEALKVAESFCNCVGPKKNPTRRAKCARHG